MSDASRLHGPPVETTVLHGFGSGNRLRAERKVLPGHARAHNRVLVLQTLYHRRAMSRADLARETGLTRVTISDLVSELIADGIVVELGVGRAGGPGKPGILIDLDRAGHQIVALDLSSAEEFEGAVVDLDGAELVRREVTRPSPDPERSYAAVRDLARSLVAAATAPVLGIGVGTPGVVLPDGVVLRAANVGWRGFPLEARLAGDLRLPVSVRNDANAAALAEFTFGAAAADLMVIRIGLGVGAGIIAGGQPLVGARSAAGEIGHVVAAGDPAPPCACGNSGCLEAWMNVPALESAIRRRPSERDDVLRGAGQRLGAGIAPIVSALDLAEVVLSGPVDLLGGILAEQLAQTLRRSILDGVFSDVVVRLTTQHDIVLRGAAVSVLSTRLGVS